MVSQASKYAGYSLGPLITYIGHVFLIRSGFLKLQPNIAFHFYLLPLYALVLFGVFSACQIIYGVLNFNDCQEASKELQREIKEAREDLTKKGLKFD